MAFWLGLPGMYVSAGLITQSSEADGMDTGCLIEVAQAHSNTNSW